ncbi:MAG: dockerin type I repeat-containing protein [Oscillospiraceae bacterium]|nr:dockerin type I repeat-containing protein [Oscillospiraceae bacterium]
MKKKLLALLISTVCCCACVGNLSASAVDETFNETDFYIVSRVNPDYDRFYMYSYLETLRNTNFPFVYEAEDINASFQKVSSAITGEKPSSFAYGDILLIDNNNEGVFSQDSYPPTLYISGDIESVQWLGNCRDILETKELTMTSKEIKACFYCEEETFDVIEHIKFNFTDENGEEYYYICYYYRGDPEVDLNTCNVGDKILASVYKDAVILPLEVYPDTTENLPGDVDGNGIVDIIDVIRMNRVTVGLDQFTSEQTKSADVNQNGKVDLNDSMQVLRYIVGLVDSLEM